MGTRFSSKISGRSALEYDFSQNFQDIFYESVILLKIFQDIPHGNTIFFKIFWIFRTGARLSSKFSGSSAREGNSLQNFQGSPYEKTIFRKIIRILRTRTRFIFFKIFKILRTRTRFSSKIDDLK